MSKYTPKDWIKNNLVTNKKINNLDQRVAELEDGSGGGSLPADFPVEGIDNANKYVGFDENGNYIAKNAPSGNSDIHLHGVLGRDDNDETTITITDSISLREIYEARAVDKNVILSVQRTDDEDVEYDTYYLNSALYEKDNYLLYFTQFNSSSDPICSCVWFDGSLVGILEEYSVVTSADLSQALNNITPLVLTFTAGANDTLDSTGATANEIWDAYAAGRDVIAQLAFDDEGVLTNDRYIQTLKLTIAVRHANQSDPTSARYSFEFYSMRFGTVNAVIFSGVLQKAEPTGGTGVNYTLTPVSNP